MARRRSDVEWPSLEPVRSTRIYEEIVRQIRLLIADGTSSPATGSRRSAISRSGSG